ncbi:hypothetical protein D3C84_726340 [compost metagenome]
MTRPLPGLMWAMMASPGIGRQQFAKVTSMPSAPLMGIFLLLDFGCSSGGNSSPSMRRATMTLMALPSPTSASRPCRFSCLVSASTCLMRGSGMSSMFLAPRAWLSRRRPSTTDSSVRRFLRNWRILERALVVTTKLSQAALGRAPGAVMISTVWPECSGLLSG